MNKKEKVVKKNDVGYSFVEASKTISEYVEESTTRLRARLLKSWRNQSPSKKTRVYA